MHKVNVKLITLGHLPRHLDLPRVKKWKSEVFQLSGEIEKFVLLGDSDINDWSFSDDLIKSQFPKNQGEDFSVAIVNVPLEDNWYSRRFEDNQIVLTFFEIRECLERENIPLENAIFRVLYPYILLYRSSGNTIPSLSKLQSFTHDETRGCLFDMNGIKSDIVESCNKPIICSECIERLKNKRVSEQTIKLVQKEIYGMKKHLYFRVVDFIKVYPVIALILSSLFAVFLGVLGSLIASVIYASI